MYAALDLLETSFNVGEYEDDEDKRVYGEARESMDEIR
jgi:hypothetical protein